MFSLIRAFILGFVLIFSNPSSACSFKNMVDLSKYAPDIEFKNYSFAHPAYLSLLGSLNKKFKIWRVTEAYPPSSRHISRCHFNGRCVDLTIIDPKQSKQICDWINEQKDFKCVNEYTSDSPFKTGRHLHLYYKGI